LSDAHSTLPVESSSGSDPDLVLGMETIAAIAMFVVILVIVGCALDAARRK
jgi:hypothetical protein